MSSAVQMVPVGLCGELMMIMRMRGVSFQPPGFFSSACRMPIQIVGTPSDFGFKGERPANPALLDWLAASPWAVWQQQAPPAWAIVLGVAGAGWLLLPKGFPARWLGLAALLPLVAVSPARPAAGEALVRVLDVGQGLAVHVQTSAHDLLYDAGPAYSADANSGDRIVVPYLRAAGVNHLDALVVSHEDKDHEGGAASVLSAIPTDLLLTSVSDRHPLAALPVLGARAGAWRRALARTRCTSPPGITARSRQRTA